MSAAIFAPMTGRGGAVTVLRIAGPGALGVLAQLTKPPPPRRAALRRLVFAGVVLDRAVVTVFPGPRSFTGDDCVELSLHGGRAVLAAVSEALTRCGARPAEPGEFSRRAFLNGRLDLLEAEATADLIAAETEAQRRLALDGGTALQEAAAGWRARLLQLMAQQEALIDFPDEELPPDVAAELHAGIAGLHDALAASLATAPAAARLRDGLEFVILGPPNAGKSTLLNALAGEDVAIVADQPGTTRDAVGARIDLAGIPVRLTDTAGLRETTDAIEAEGIRRARAKGADADLIIAVAAAPAPVFAAIPPGVAALHVITKADLLAARPMGFALVSAQTGEGLAELRAQLAQRAAHLTDTRSAPALSRPRQIGCIRDTVAALARALEAGAPELCAEDLRNAAHALARLTGAIGVEEVLDAVFGSFCIGK